MCSASEARDRQLHLELSEFESTSETYTLGPRNRIVNPSLVVKKYRRSAAGGGVASSSGGSSSSHRSVKDLSTTVSHLLGYVLPNQRTYASTVMPSRPLARTVTFVDDRVRAVQVDLTTSLGAINDSHHNDSDDDSVDWSEVRTIQSRLVRYNILISYLLSDLPSTKYETKFGKVALRTAVDCYFAAWEAQFGGCGGGGGGVGPSEAEWSVYDEVLSYEALMHVAESLRAGEGTLPTGSGGDGGGGGGCGAVLASYLKRGGGGTAAVVIGGGDGGNVGGQHGVPDLMDEDFAPPAPTSSSRSSSTPPSGKWAIALEIAAAADSGNLIRIFKLLLGDGEHDDKASSSSVTESSSWRVLARCCVVPAINVIRIGLVRRYNKSFGKMEKVSGEDLARLLHLPTPQSAIQFCTDVGLPTTEDNNRVIVKAAPISIADKCVIDRMVNPGRGEDALVFVFGGGEMEAWRSAKSGGGGGVAGEDDDWEEETNADNNDTSRGVGVGAVGGRPLPPSAEEQQKQKPRQKQSPANKSRWGDESSSDSEEENEDRETNTNVDDATGTGGGNEFARVDEDGVLVPPARVIWELLR